MVLNILSLIFQLIARSESKCCVQSFRGGCKSKRDIYSTFKIEEWMQNFLHRRK